ncbi:hypothetical protein ILUMI_02268 [Ignelater luminosus]|uniref:DDE Tnp4 domain-containing protein n=1 Tax=Ignelater luminosus TaxID=2038154 RepID=A0A8K0DIK3_IGNLU|nr:hypothetical protein ILUMI_02268 [Ignelater luminosus]
MLATRIFLRYVELNISKKIVQVVRKREQQQADKARLKTAEILLELAEGHHKNATDNSEHTVDVDNSEHTADVDKEQLQVNNTPIFSDKSSVSPSGMMTYLSKAYGGRASDKAIFNKEKIIELLIPGHDAIMVDKGFLIDDECKRNYIKLYRPLFLGRGKSQFSKEEAVETAEIARARVHVERRIQRLKNFTLLKNRYSWTLLPLIDDIFVTVSALVNLYEPILSSDKF